jgi:hypothetical protein
MKIERAVRTLGRFFTWRRTMIVTATVVGLTALSASSDLPIIGSTEAQAVIGRPWTPLSYAGVARRTVRRYGYYY